MGRRDGTIAARRRPVSHLFSRSVAPIVPVLRPLFRFQKIWPLKRASVEKHNRTHIFEKIGENGKRINSYSYPYPIYPPISPTRAAIAFRYIYALCFFFLLRPPKGLTLRDMRGRGEGETIKTLAPYSNLSCTHALRF